VLYPETLHDATVDQVFLNDLVDVLSIDPRVPHTLGIDDNTGSFTAAVQAAGGIDSHPPLSRDPERLRPLLGVVPHGQRIKVLTTIGTVLSKIGAEKYVVTIVTV